MVAKGLVGLERVPSNRIFTIGNGVDIDRFHPNAIESRRVQRDRNGSIGPNELVLLTMAHNHRFEGVPQLVEFLRRAKDLPCKMHLMIAGGHNQTPEFLSVGEHKVTFLGPIAEPLDAYGWRTFIFIQLFMMLAAFMYLKRWHVVSRRLLRDAMAPPSE